MYHKVIRSRFGCLFQGKYLGSTEYFAQATFVEKFVQSVFIQFGGVSEFIGRSLFERRVVGVASSYRELTFKYLIWKRETGLIDCWPILRKLIH